jgi:hypothetical protein
MASSVRVSSLSGFLLGFGLGVSQSNVKLLASLDNSKSLGNANALSDLTTVSSVVHEEEFSIFLARDQEFLEAVWEHVSGLTVLLVTNLHFLLVTSHSSSHEAIDTSNLSVGVWL